MLDLWTASDHPCHTEAPGGGGVSTSRGSTWSSPDPPAEGAAPVAVIEGPNAQSFPSLYDIRGLVCVGDLRGGVAGSRAGPRPPAARPAVAGAGVTCVVCPAQAVLVIASAPLSQ